MFNSQDVGKNNPDIVMLLF